MHIESLAQCVILGLETIAGEIVTGQSKYSNVAHLNEEFFNELFKLEHSQFLKFNMYIDLKMKLLLKTMELDISSYSFSDHTNSWVGLPLLGLGSMLTRKNLPTDKLAELFNTNLIGIDAIDRLSNCTMYGWYRHHYKHDVVVSSFRESIVKGFKTRQPIMPRVSFKWHMGKDDVNFKLIGTDTVLAIQPDKYYVVTATTEDYKIGMLEQYDLAKHHDLKPSEQSLNGWILKFNSDSEGVSLEYLYDSLNACEFKYGFEILGLENVA